MAEAAALLFCDHAYVDPGSGKTTLLGIFTELRPTRYPTPFRHFVVYAMLRGEVGETGWLSFICRSANKDEELIRYRKNLIFASRKALPFIMQIGEFRFRRAGWYRFDLEFSGVNIASSLLYLHEAP